MDLAQVSRVKYEKKYSKTRLRIPKDFYRELKDISDSKGISIVEALQNAWKNSVR